jgi:tRNA (guanine-N(7)-)-methyltransferase subunit TRM82
VSGGGDPVLYAWNWAEGKLLHRLDLFKAWEEFEKAAGQPSQFSTGQDVTEMRKEASSASKNIPPISGLFNILSSPDHNHILAIFEGYPVGMIFALKPDGQLSYVHSITAFGNILDVAVLDDQLILCTDTVHKPGSTSEKAESSPPKLYQLENYHFGAETWIGGGKYSEGLKTFSDHPITVKSPSETFWDSLYSLESLRKRE